MNFQPNYVREAKNLLITSFVSILFMDKDEANIHYPTVMHGIRKK